MQEQERKQKEESVKIGGLRIRYLNYIFITLLVIVAVVLLWITMTLSSEYSASIQIADDYHRLETDARMVQSASDDLTRSVRLFVMTGKKEYMDEYFTEANVTKRRENAIEDLKSMQATESLLQPLENSVHESMALMLLEYEAMRYASEGYGLDLEDLPPEVKDCELPKEAGSMTSEEKIEEAKSIVFGTEYFDYKDRIRSYEEQYLQAAFARMDSLQNQGRSSMRRLIALQRSGIAIMGILGLILYFCISRLIVSPLDTAVQKISKGDKVLPLDGTYEIQYMCYTFNTFHRISRDKQEQLQNEAEHDALTGVLNRRGYRLVIDELTQKKIPIALLVMDLDDFKQVNDNYGHSIGDEALKKAARLLQETFRGTDVTARIGGDEFTVIMTDISGENRAVIEDKINRINRVLQTSGLDGCPPLSMSVGCAFSESGYDDYLFTQADSRLYEAKDAGGGRVRFAEEA